MKKKDIIRFQCTMNFPLKEAKVHSQYFVLKTPISMTQKYENKAKINFNPHILEKLNGDNFVIDKTQTWQQAQYYKEQDIRGLWRLNESAKKKRSKKADYYLSGMVTNKNEEAQKQRLMNIRDQLHQGKFSFSKSFFTTSKALKRSENATTNKSLQSSEEEINKHSKLLNRIYSYSCEQKRHDPNFQRSLKKISIRQYKSLKKVTPGLECKKQIKSPDRKKALQIDGKGSSSWFSDKSNIKNGVQYRIKNSKDYLQII